MRAAPRPGGHPYRPPRRMAELDRPHGRFSARDRSRADSRRLVTFRQIRTFATRFILIAALLYLAWRAIFVIVTVLAAALLALTLAPIVNALARPAWLGLGRGARRGLATAAVFVLLFVAIGLAYVLLVAPFLSEVGRLVKTLGQESAGWRAYLAWVQEQINNLPPEARNALKGLNTSTLATSASRFVRDVLLATVKSLSHIVELVLIPVLAFYFIVEGRGLKREFVVLAPPRWRRDALSIARTTGRILRDYTVANLVLCLIAGVVVYAILRILDIRFALSLSVLAGITRFVPIVGPIIGAIPIILLSLAKGPSTAATVLVFFILLHLVESKVLLPKLIGHRLHIHGAVVLIVLLLGGEFAGIPGMFIAAPVAALLRELIRTYLLHIRRRSGHPHTGHPRPIKSRMESVNGHVRP